MTQTLTFIDTNKLPRVKTPQGEATEVRTTTHWSALRTFSARCGGLKSGEQFKAAGSDKHQLIYLMEGAGTINLDTRIDDALRRRRHLGPTETATIR